MKVHDIDNPGQNVWDKVPFSRIAAIFARSPLPPDAMLDNSSASLYLRTTLYGGRGGGGGEDRIWPKELFFPCEKLIDGRGSAFCKLVPHNFARIVDLHAFCVRCCMCHFHDFAYSYVFMRNIS